MPATRGIGDTWLMKAATALLAVPSDRSCQIDLAGITIAPWLG